jgi:hypothetical protein
VYCFGEDFFADLVAGLQSENTQNKCVMTC